MKAITKKEMRQLELKLADLKKMHPRRYGRLRFHLSDIGNRIMLGFDSSLGGFTDVTGFMGYESMWNCLHYLAYPIDRKIINELEFERKLKSDYGILPEKETLRVLQQ